MHPCTCFFLKNFEAFILYRHIFGAQTPEDVVEKSKIPADRLNFYIKNYVEMGLIKKKRGNLEVIGKGYFNLSQCPALAHRLIEKWVPWFMDRAVAYKGKPDYDLKAMSTGLSKIHKAQLLEDLERLFQRYKDIGFQDQKVGTEEFESVGVCIGIGPHRIGFFEEKNSTTAARRY